MSIQREIHLLNMEDGDTYDTLKEYSEPVTSALTVIDRNGIGANHVYSALRQNKDEVGDFGGFGREDYPGIKETLRALERIGALDTSRPKVGESYRAKDFTVKEREEVKDSINLVEYTDSVLEPDLPDKRQPATGELEDNRQSGEY